MTIKATIQAVAEPTKTGTQLTASGEVIKSNIFLSPAPKIIGIDSKNENRADSILVNPRIIPPPIVAPDRENPGIRAKT